MKPIMVLVPEQPSLNNKVQKILDRANCLMTFPVMVQGSDAAQSVNACYQQIAEGYEKSVLWVNDPHSTLFALRSILGVRAVVVNSYQQDLNGFNVFILSHTVKEENLNRRMSAVVAAEAPSVDELYVSVAQEWVKQQFSWNMVASESLASHSVCALQGSVLTNKYAEGYPGARYYGGCAVVDVVESLAQERAKSLFNCQFANVQPHSGSQANQAVYTALLDAGDTILGMDLAHGGHLTHGFPINSSGKLYKGIAYPVVKQTGLIDYDEVERLAVKHNPRLIIAGASAYSRIIDYKRFRVIADKVGAYLMADIAHIAGLIAAGILPSPFPYASVVTSTTHKTLKGPRGGLILCEDQEMSSKINKGVFPGTQGGPLMHVIAAKAQAFKEASTDAYKAMMHNVVEGAQLMSKTLRSEGFDVLTGGTDNHKILVDLRSMRVEGKVAEDRLAAYCIFANKNMVPYDTASPMNPSGIRLGSMALACRGMKGDIFAEVAHIIAEIILDKPECDHRARIAQLCARYPINTAPSDEN